MADLPDSLSRYRGAIEEKLRSILADGNPLLLYHMMRYHMGWEDEAGRPSRASGKALRPSLCLWACEAIGGDWRRALPAAAALELVHEFSLIHDDIQDGDIERRHRPTVWYLWGQAQAINAGDAMLTIANQTLSRLERTGLPPAKILRASDALHHGVLRMIEGQCLDLSFEDSLEIGVDAYLDMIGKKTGALFRCALYLGALVASEDEEQWESIGRGGEALGLAFQVVDDVLGVWGVEERTGKAAEDIRRRKKSLPVVYAFEKANGPSRQELLSTYSKTSLDDADVNIVLAILDDLKARDYCYSIADDLGQRALSHIRASKVSISAKMEMEEIVGFLLEREY